MIQLTFYVSDDLNMEQMEMNVEMIEQLMDMNLNLGLLWLKEEAEGIPQCASVT